MRRVLVDQGSGAEIMYPGLYKGLKLKPKDLVNYDSPLVGLMGRQLPQMARLDFLFKQGQRLLT